MKILKEGDPKRLRRPIVFQCLNCGCEFEAEKYEYEQNLHDGTCCRCPYCGTNTWEILQIMKEGKK